MPYRTDPVFGFQVPMHCAGVPEEILDPARTWGNRDEYYRKYDALAARFIDNFKLLAAGCPPEVVNAGPRRLDGTPPPEAVKRAEPEAETVLTWLE